ncbi:YfbU family protein [Corynebacterium poyangense]
MPNGSAERESQMAVYTEYLVKNGRWTEQEELIREGTNSHRQMLPTYQVMLGAFKPIWREAVRGSSTRRRALLSQRSRSTKNPARRPRHTV